MNDEELITVLREQRGTITMNTPVEQIIGRGRAVRSRHRLPAAALATATLAAAAVAVTAALPASHPAGTHDAKLAAWMVVRQADDGIVVTVSELQDPAGLQSTLRADGVPASVTFTGQGNPACQGYPGTGTQSQRRQVLGSIVTVPYESQQNAMIIHPGALPSGGGLFIAAAMRNHPGARGGIELTVGLVQASPQCTGS
ncbi:MAG: hypothetical protein ACRDPY_25595 [Streptosporangiaceae bacterium]